MPCLLLGRGWTWLAVKPAGSDEDEQDQKPYWGVQSSSAFCWPLRAPWLLPAQTPLPSRAPGPSGCRAEASWARRLRRERGGAGAPRLCAGPQPMCIPTNPVCGRGVGRTGCVGRSLSEWQSRKGVTDSCPRSPAPSPELLCQGRGQSLSARQRPCVWSTLSPPRPRGSRRAAVARAG